MAHYVHNPLHFMSLVPICKSEFIYLHDIHLNSRSGKWFFQISSNLTSWESTTRMGKVWLQQSRLFFSFIARMSRSENSQIRLFWGLLRIWVRSSNYWSINPLADLDLCWPTKTLIEWNTSLIGEMCLDRTYFELIDIFHYLL